MGFERSSGILLHPTSLPGAGGIGTLGVNARAFVDILSAAGIGLWQVLPLGPTGYGDAPYSALSAFAGNPLLIAIEPLVERGWLSADDLSPLEGLPESHVDFGRVIPAKTRVLRTAFERYRQGGQLDPSIESFKEANRDWLDDFALYMSVKDAQGGAPWNLWDAPLRRRDPAALDEARSSLADDIAFHTFAQALFFQQWEEIKRYANERDIRVIGDIPIFVAYDSADVWANQHLFQLDENGTPLVVAGVPPDYFSVTGQLWGNPHYRWDVLASTGFSWWIERFRLLLRLVDVVRLDHFRGFAAAWTVPHGNSTAEQGEWVEAPGAALFTALRSALGDLPIIAEDLGVITPDVEALRDHFGFPGMKILQFAFSSDASDAGLPHNYTRNCVVYTGTHDNDTTVGWFLSLTDAEREAVLRYTGTTGLDISWDLIHLAFASVADMAVVPMQDILRLGTAARMNYPGRPEGNWTWRLVPNTLGEGHVAGLRRLSETYGRTSVGVVSTQETV